MTGSCTRKMKLRNYKLIQYPFETAMLTTKNIEKQIEAQVGKGQIGFINIWMYSKSGLENRY
jgi:adenosylcobinamide amidohydrolase